jgi:hypothetical protein
MCKRNAYLLLCLVLTVNIFAQSTSTVWLDDLPIQTFSEGLRPVEAKASYAKDTISTLQVMAKRRNPTFAGAMSRKKNSPSTSIRLVLKADI